MSSDENYMGSNVTHMRKLLKLTRKQLSLIVGTSINKLTRIENNLTASADYYLLEAIASYFGCSVTGLVRDDMRKVNEAELRFRQLTHNAHAFGEYDRRAYVIITESAMEELVKKDYFKHRRRKMSANQSRPALPYSGSGISLWISSYTSI